MGISASAFSVPVTWSRGLRESYWGQAAAQFPPPPGQTAPAQAATGSVFPPPPGQRQQDSAFPPPPCQGSAPTSITVGPSGGGLGPPGGGSFAPPGGGGGFSSPATP